MIVDALQPHASSAARALRGAGLDVATGDRQDRGAEGDGDPSGEDQGSGSGAENFAPRPFTVVNTAAAELGRTGIPSPG